MTKTHGPVSLTLGGHTYHDATLSTAEYADGTLALQATCDDGSPLATLSVRLVNNPPAEGCIWVKDWSENEGALASLLELGLVEVTGRSAKTGFVSAWEARLLGPLA